MCGEVGRDFFYDDSTKERFSFLLPMNLQNMHAKEFVCGLEFYIITQLLNNREKVAKGLY